MVCCLVVHGGVAAEAHLPFLAVSPPLCLPSARCLNTSALVSGENRLTIIWIMLNLIADNG